MVFWECFTRHLLTPKKETQLQSWTLEGEYYNRKCKNNVKRLLKRIMVTQKDSSFTSLPALWDSSFCHVEHLSMNMCWPTFLTSFTKRETTDYDAGNFGMDQQTATRKGTDNMQTLSNQPSIQQSLECILLKIKVSVVTLASFWCSQASLSKFRSSDLGQTTLNWKDHVLTISSAICLFVTFENIYLISERFVCES